MQSKAKQYNAKQCNAMQRNPNAMESTRGESRRGPPPARIGAAGGAARAPAGARVSARPPRAPAPHTLHYTTDFTTRCTALFDSHYSTVSTSRPNRIFMIQTVLVRTDRTPVYRQYSYIPHARTSRKPTPLHCMHLIESRFTVSQSTAELQNVALLRVHIRTCPRSQQTQTPAARFT